MLEYHNKLFGRKDKVNAVKTAENKKVTKIKPKKSDEEKIILNKENESRKKELFADNVSLANSKESDNNNYYVFGPWLCFTFNYCRMPLFDCKKDKKIGC